MAGNRPAKAWRQRMRQYDHADEGFVYAWHARELSWKLSRRRLKPWRRSIALECEAT